MVVVSIEFDHPYFFGHGKGYSKRIYLLFDGIHYDIIVRSFAEGLEENYDVLIFDPSDKHALNGAKVIANNLRIDKKYTNTDKFKLRCGIC